MSRTRIAGGFATFALLAAFSIGARPASAGENVYGLQLHLHGSLSEGAGSMRGHAYAARQLKGAVDVLWWSDHDWRIAGYTYVTGFDFEHGLAEGELVPAPLRTSQWEGASPLPAWAHFPPAPDGSAAEGMERSRKGWRTLGVAHPARDAKLGVSEDEARHGRRSLRVEMEGRGRVWERVALDFQASRRRQVASLASGVRLRLSVLPAVLQGDARLVLKATLSQQPPALSQQPPALSQRPQALQSRIEYRLTTAGVAAHERHVSRVRGGASKGRALDLALIDLPFQPGVWNDFVLDLTADAEAQGLGGIDNSLTDFALSVEARRGGRLIVYIDSFEIERAKLGDDLFRIEKKFAQQLSDSNLRSYVGQEVSYAAHLNLFGPKIPLADLRTHPHGYTPQEAVALAHEHGGIVSLNHFFGVSTELWGYSFPNERVDRLIAARGYDADLLEVGYRRRGYDLGAFVRLWDRLSNAGVVMTGVGVSDSHDNDIGWLEGPNNFITWALAPSPSQPDLIEALRAGRAFFGDPTRFSGRIDIVESGGGRMGQIVVTGGESRIVRYRVEGLRPGQRVAIVHDGATTREITPEAGDFATVTEEKIETREQPHFVRLEVREGKEPVAFSNPIYFRPSAPAGHEYPARMP